ncbi:MAG: metallophosphoesterase [Magnetococcales bacterium]|nr:metallophosphoesterase [Magnetococcales bacterium]
MFNIKLRSREFFAALAESPPGVVRCRRSWRQERERREKILVHHFDPSGWDDNWFGNSLKGLQAILKKSALYDRGIQNALNIQVVSEELFFPNLPEAFDGYTILHLSDLHFGSLPQVDDIIIQTLDNQECDLCVITGDFRASILDSHDHLLTQMKRVVNTVAAHDGFLAVLGNHDAADMAEPLDELGCRVLINARVILRRQDAAMHILGLDDTHFFPSRMAMAALAAPRQENFSILLVHSPDVAQAAARNGFDLYLCGHTHGGQICWPTGTPILTGLRDGLFHHSHGLWRQGSMLGRTSNGLGASLVPVRFFNRPEIVRIVLRKRLDAVPQDVVS